MKKLNSLAIKCVADAVDAQIITVTRRGVTYAVTAHCRQDAEDAVTAHLAAEQPEPEQGPELFQ